MELRGTALSGRSARLGLAFVLSLAVLIVGALATGELRTKLAEGTVAPSLPASLGPSAAPVPTSTATTTTPPAAGCAATNAPDSVRITLVTVPSYGLDARFTACSVWLQSIDNGGGIERLDLATNRVVATIVPDEVVEAIAASGDSIWALSDTALASRLALVRIDPATNTVAERIPMPAMAIKWDAGVLTIVNDSAWIIGRGSRQVADPADPTRTIAVFDGADTIRVFDLASHELADTIELPSGVSRAWVVGVGPDAVWVAGQPQNSGGTTALMRVDLTTHAVTTLDPPSGATSCVLAGDALFCGTGRGEVVELSTASGETIRTTALGISGDVDLAAAGPDVWAMSTAIVDTPEGKRLEARELVHLDAISGDIVGRIERVFRQPMDLWIGGGSLWVDTTSPDGLVRLELPAP